MIIQFSDLQKQRDFKKTVVMDFLIRFYNDLQYTKGVEIPYFVRANDTYKELIHNNKELNLYYRKVLEHTKNE